MGWIQGRVGYTKSIHPMKADAPGRLPRVIAVAVCLRGSEPYRNARRIVAAAQLHRSAVSEPL